MKRVNDTLYDLIDSYTGENFNYTKVTTYADGTAMDDTKCDGVIYRKLGAEYFKRNFTGAVNVKWFGAKGDGITDDTLAIQSFFNFISNSKTQGIIEDGIFACGYLVVNGYFNLIGSGTLKCINPEELFANHYAWINCDGSNEDFYIKNINFDNNVNALTNPNIPLNDGENPETWKDFFAINVKNYNKVNIEIFATNFKRFCLVQNSNKVLVNNNITDCKAVRGECVFVISYCESLLMTKNVLTGLDFFAGSVFGSDVQSLHGLYAYETYNCLVNNNDFKGHQLVIRSANPAGTIVNGKIIVSGNTIDTPPADTAVYGYNNIIVSGNKVLKSGDYGITFDYSIGISCFGNTIDGASVGGIYFRNTKNTSCNNNIIKNIGQSYPECSHVPNINIAHGITVTTPDYGNIENVSVFNNIFSFDADKTPPANGRGKAIVFEVTTNPAKFLNNTAICQSNIVENQIWDYIVIAPENLGYVSNILGDFIPGETIIGGTSGKKGRFEVLIGELLWLSALDGQFTTGETLNGELSASTATAGNSGGGPQFRNTGVLNRNTDKYSNKKGILII